MRGYKILAYKVRHYLVLQFRLSSCRAVLLLSRSRPTTSSLNNTAQATFLAARQRTAAELQS